MTTQPTDKRLIEHYIPIKQISAEASREKSIRHGHISTLHLWWARRPLVACRAAVFAALVPAPKDANEERELNKLMIDLCKWEVGESVLEEARRRIREAYPDGPPKVLDMFAGGGSIPLEALRLGCEAYALDLNPVAHIIELATLVYPQKYGPGLAEDVRRWGEWMLERVRAEVGDLYPLIPDPEHTPEKAAAYAADFREKQQRLFHVEGDQLSLGETGDDDSDEDDPDSASANVPPGYLMPVAYLWTRTVTCPNPDCRATVPLVRQTWLKKKKGDNVALEMRPHPTENRMAFYVRKAQDEKGFGFDPAGFSQRGNSTCYRCGMTVTSDYVKQEGKAGRMSAQMMATVCVRPSARGKAYLTPDEMDLPLPDEADIRARIAALTEETGIDPPDEPLPDNDMRNFWTPQYGLTRFSDLFTPRQMLTLLTFVKWVREAHKEIVSARIDEEYAKGLVTYLALLVDKLADYNASLCRWVTGGEFVSGVYARQALPMVWDFAETNSFAGASGSYANLVQWMLLALNNCYGGLPATVTRGSATSLPFHNEIVDGVVTDPPYYDNISYSDLSDFYYVWLRRSLGFLYVEHLANELAPKKQEAIAADYRHTAEQDAREFYEGMMLQAFQEAHRILKPYGLMVTVYAHKTTVGWSTLVEALRTAGFMVTEAWPLDTERPSRSISIDTAALASSIFLIARKRDNGHAADYVRDVQPEMQRIARERVRFFLQMGISGADLNIATVGAGLAPYTRYARVELPNGEELTAAAYLDAVQAEVVKVLLGEASQADSPTQYAIMARAYYGEAWVDFDEANNLARAIGIELDSGAHALTKGAAALVEKNGAKVRVLTYVERGDHDSLGLPDEDGTPAPLIDVLHRLLWLAENDNSAIEDFLNQAMPDKFKLRLVAENLKGRSLAAEPTPGAMRDTRTAEQRAIDVLLASWNRIVQESKMI